MSGKGIGVVRCEEDYHEWARLRAETHFVVQARINTNNVFLQLFVKTRGA